MQKKFSTKDSEGSMKQNKPIDFCVYDLKRLSNLKVTGSIHKICYPRSKEHIQQAFVYAIEKGRIPYVLGGGSNTLIGHLDKIMLISDYNCKIYMTYKEPDLIVSSNFYITKLCFEALRFKLHGLEFLAGVPAHLGGAICMNAGAYGHNILDFVKWIKVIDENGERKIEKEDIKYGYRHTNIKGFINEVCLNLEKTDNVGKATRDLKRTIGERKDKHPMDMPNLGCFFKNPESFSAGVLIEQAGLKGFSIGGAQVSEKHANFLVNTGGASFEDFITLIEHIKREVYSKFKINLEEEVRIINE
jgi:UDP-N-acetylmuramate dehydrogenase